MLTRVHDGWLEPPLAKKWTIGLAENLNEVEGALIGFLLLIAFIVSLVGVSSAFVLGTIYIGSHVTDLPFIGQFFGP
jgi:hypothetical protein